MAGDIHNIVRAGMLWLAALPVLAGQVVDPAAVRQAVRAPEVAAIDAALASLAAGHQVGELALRLEGIAGDASLEPVARAWLLDRGLHELARLAPTPEARGVVLDLSHRRPEVFTRVDPDHGNRTVPLYDTGATARFVLESWQRDAARDAARQDLDGGRITAVDRFAAGTRSPAGDPARAGIIEAYARAPLSQLPAQRDAVAAAMKSGAPVDELALVLARRLTDSELATLVLDRADAPVALAAVRSLPSTFEAHAALELLRHAGGRSELASAAMLEIGGLARHDGAARTALLEALEDADLGPSAAAALAGLADPAVTMELGQRLRAARSDWSRRMYVLALKLDGGPAAREELQGFLETQQGAAQLRGEVRYWLER